VKDAAHLLSFKYTFGFRASARDVTDP